MNIFKFIYDKNQDNLSKPCVSMRYTNDEYTSFTYGQTFDNAILYAHLLKKMGLNSGDRVALVGENSPEWVMCYLAMASIDVTSVLIDPSLTKNEIITLIDNSDVRLILFSPKVNEKLSDYNFTNINILNIQNNLNYFKGREVYEALPPSTDMDPSINTIIYSSGTTRVATGIMHTHDAIIGTTLAAIDFNHLTGNDRMLAIIPLYHIYGVITSMVGPLVLGCSIHFIEGMAGPNVIAAFKEFQPTVFPCIPKVFDVFKENIISKIMKSSPIVRFVYKKFLPICVNIRKKTGVNLGKKIFNSVHEGFGGHINIFCAAGAPLDPDTAYFYYGMGFNLLLNYGLTETNVPIIANNFENYTLHSCGKPYPHVEAIIHSPDENGFGEIYVKTPFMMKGYFHNEEATKAAFDHGWFKTGDIGQFDVNGNILITGRLKDNIVLSTGKKVTPDDIENKYTDIDCVSELVVCGIPEKTGSHDIIHAFVIPQEHTSLTHSQIEEYIYAKGSRLSPYMRITQIHFVNNIPKTSLQKPKRYLLKKSYLDSVEQQNNTLSETASTVVNNTVAFTTQEKIIQIIKSIRELNFKITKDTKIYEDLGFDSLNIMSLAAEIESKFKKSIHNHFKAGITIHDIETILNSEDVSTAKDHQVNINDFPYKRTFLDNMIFNFTKIVRSILYKFSVSGLENLPSNNGFLLCPNHTTFLDTYWILLSLPKQHYNNFCCVSKKELIVKNILSKCISRVSGAIPVDRAGNSAPTIKRCIEKLKEGSVLMIFPEGTRSHDGQLGEFKKGAAKLSIDSNCPIIPVKISGAHEMYPRGRAMPKFFNYNKFRRYAIHITYGKPIDPNDYDPVTLTETVKNELSKLDESN